MKHPKLTKAATLLLFLSLISAFLLYRTGRLDTYFSGESTNNTFQTSPNGGTISPSENDTVPTPYTDSLIKLRMSSSKSAILTEPRSYDTSLLRKAIEEQNAIEKQRALTNPQKDKERMSSSKSLILVTPRKPVKKFDTANSDIKQLKQRNNEP
jgi:hypothetical protein